MANIKTVVCTGIILAGSPNAPECPCSCEPSEPPVDPCDMECVSPAEDYNEAYDEFLSGGPFFFHVDVVITFPTSAICDQDTVQGSIALTNNTGNDELDWEVIEISDTPVFELVSSSHSEGQTGTWGIGATITFTATWRYHSNQAVPDENCCISEDFIGPYMVIEFATNRLAILGTVIYCGDINE